MTKNFTALQTSIAQTKEQANQIACIAEQEKLKTEYLKRLNHDRECESAAMAYRKEQRGGRPDWRTPKK